MSLARRTRRAFSDRVRRRGEGYARSGSIELVSVGDDEIVAGVQGSESEPYRVRGARSGGRKRPRLGVSCTCPYFADGEPCKHVWALILTVDVSPGADSMLTGALDLGDVRLTLASGFVLHGGTISRCDENIDFRWLDALQAGLRIPARDVDAFVAKVLSTPGSPPLELPGDLGWTEQRVDPTPRVRFQRLTEGGAAPLSARLDFLYGETEVEPTDPAPCVCLIRC